MKRQVKVEAWSCSKRGRAPEKSAAVYIYAFSLRTYQVTCLPNHCIIGPDLWFSRLCTDRCLYNTRMYTVHAVVYRPFGSLHFFVDRSRLITFSGEEPRKCLRKFRCYLLHPRARFARAIRALQYFLWSVDWAAACPHLRNHHQTEC